jgi:hypothetical protein
MVWKIINIDNVGQDNTYGGNDTKKIMKLLRGYNLLDEDPTDTVNINTEVNFYNEKLKMRSPTTGFHYIWRTQDIIADRYISLPLMTGDGEISLAATSSINDWGTNLQTFRSGSLAIRNPANTFSYFLITSAISANRNIIVPLLTADDTLVFENKSATLTDKTLVNPTFSTMTFNTDSNTLKHSTTNNSGDLLVNNGTKFERKNRGTANQLPIMNATGTDLTWIDKANLGSGGGGGGGGTGDFMFPIAGNTISGAWYGVTTAGGAGVWSDYLTNVSNVSTVDINDGSGRMGQRYNFTSDDDRGGFRTNNHHFYRMNDPELWVRYRYDPLSATHTSSTNYRVVVGFTNDVTADYGTDGSLNNKSCFMWFKETADTVTLVGRNDGDATGDKDSSQLSLTQTDANVNTIRIFGDSTNNRFGISLNGGTAVYYTTEIPAATTRLGCIVQFENENSDDRSVEILGAYFKAKVI